MKSNELFNKVVCPVSTKYGAPMGRSNIGNTTDFIPTTKQGAKCIIDTIEPDTKSYDRKVPLTQGYDKGGAYWGGANNLRVAYNKTLTIIIFYRESN